MRKGSVMALALVVALAGGALAACDDGPAEEAGEKIDNAVEKAGDAVERKTD